jgi:adenosylcobyric acid synthase
MLEEKSGIPVAGVVPYMDIKVEDEDSLSERLSSSARGLIDIAVIRLPKISNFTDFDVFEQFPDVSVRYVSDPSQLDGADLVILPGSKSTIADLHWFREKGLEEEILKMHAGGIPVIGICGGYQMLGLDIADPDGVEGGGSIEGLGLLPVSTVLAGDKRTVQFSGRVCEPSGIFASLAGLEVEGYEIHMGRTTRCGRDSDDARDFTTDGTGVCSDNVYGTYVHGFFDRGAIASSVVESLAERKGIRITSCEAEDHRDFKEKEYDRLADNLRKHLDMDLIYSMLREASI